MFDHSTYASVTTPNGRLRWHQLTEGCEPVLQQEFDTVELGTGKRTTEWCAVPLVAE